jgi:outer membrane protein assembly factor BamD
MWFVLLAAALMGGCFGKKANAPTAGTAAEPDKVLYTKSSDDIKHGRFTVGRLGLQTLINTYPDSEYLAKAKLEIGDSYYKEGGMAGLKQSIVEYKDFITFFPFLDEAPYAQMQIGMAHYRQMEKPDRDHAEAVQAEAELQTFLEKYPNSPLVPLAAQRLRDTQEVLAEGNFRVARFYYIRGGYRAAGARLLELTNRYPLYSQADQANWMLGQIYEKTEHNDVAARYYGRIVKDYPLSSLAGDAKDKLVKFGVPVPPADPASLARMQKDQAAAEHMGFIAHSMEIMRSKPDVSTASRTGDPTMTPSGESGDETLSFGPQPGATVGAGSATGSTATVETVTPGSASSLAPAATSSSDSAPAADSTPASTDSTQPASTSTTTAAPADKSQESTTKKKKGIHKIIPF